MKTLKTKLGAALFAALLTTASAQPAYLNYQGRLTDNNGQPLPSSGTNNLAFNIYTAATGGTLLWGPFLCDGGAGAGHTARTIVSSGRFNVILGPTDTSSRSIGAIFTTNDNLFLEIQVNGATIAPRQQFLTAAYTFEASHADQSSTVSDPNVAYRNTANVFTAINRFAGVVQATNVNNQLVGSFSGPANIPYLRFVETAAGASVAGANNFRNFEERDDTHNIGSVNGSGDIDLPAGTYLCRISVPGFRIETHQARLRVPGGSPANLFGTIGYSDNSTEGSQDRSEVVGQFVITASTTLQVQHYCWLAKGDGLGTVAQAINWNDGNGEQPVYSVAEFWKVK